MTEKHICPNCKRVLRKVNAPHYCKEVAIDDLFVDKTDEIVLAFDRIYQRYLEADDVDISATKNCVVFLRNKTFLVIKPMKKWLEVKFYSPGVIEDDSLHKCELWGKKFHGIVRFESEHQINQRFFEYFEVSYEMS
jgi:hypothetical protein